VANSQENGGAEKYGKDIAILIGDLMHGCVSLLVNRLSAEGVGPEVILQIMRIIAAELTPSLVDGEARDVRFSRERIGSVSEENIIEMLEGKTAALFEFCGTAGAMIGLNSTNASDKRIQALAGYSRSAGLAFQIQDDILGLTGDEDKLGKPRGSDLREGKHTLLLYHAFKNGTKEQIESIQALIGKPDINPDEVDLAEKTLRQIGTIEHVRNIAREYIESALPFLDDLDDSPSKELLADLAEFMIEREF